MNVKVALLLHIVQKHVKIMFVRSNNNFIDIDFSSISKHQMASH